MNYREKIKKIFFTSQDLGISGVNDDAETRRLNETLIIEGAESRTLMQSPIFQSAVADIYLHLEAELDAMEPTQANYDAGVAWILAQRRSLRQICALLDNKIAAQEQLEASLKETADEK